MAVVLEFCPVYVLLTLCMQDLYYYADMHILHLACLHHSFAHMQCIGIMCVADASVALCTCVCVVRNACIAVLYMYILLVWLYVLWVHCIWAQLVVTDGSDAGFMLLVLDSLLDHC